MIPTKPISPLTATAAAVPSVAATTTASRTRPTSTPRLAASSSPTLSTSSTRRCSRSTSELRPRCTGSRSRRRASRESEAAEEPRVDLLQRVRVLLLDERLHGREERRDRDAGEDERRPPRVRRPAERPIAYATTTASDRRRRTRRAAARSGSRSRRQRRRSRASRRGRPRRRRRAGTGRRAGSGTRPGRRRPRPRASPPTSAPSTTRGQPQLPEHRLVGRRRAASGRGGTARRERRRPRIAPSPMCTGPTARRSAERRPGTPRADEPAQADTAAPRRAGAAPPAPRRPPLISRRFAIPAATARTNSTIRGPQRDATSSSTPTTRAGPDGGDRRPARAARRPSSAVCPQHLDVGEDDDLRVLPRRCTRPRAADSRCRSVSAASAMFRKPNSL